MSKDKLISSVAILVIIAGVVWFAMQTSKDSAPNQSSDGSPEATEDKPPEFATVEEVLDGDEIILNTGHHIRYIGVRTPTVASEIQCFGPEAVQANESIIGQQVRLEEEPLLDRASDGAWTRYVWLIQGEVDPSPTPEPSPEPDEETEQSEDPRDILINERIIEGGFGFPVVSEEMVYGARMLAAARFSAATKKGLWAQCETTQTASGHTITKPSDECAIKGFRNDADKKVYRTPNCGFYAQTIVLPQQKEGQYFCTTDEAELNGFSKALDCP